MRPEQLTVVYHVAGLPGFEAVAGEQLAALAAAGLRQPLVTFVGQGLPWFLDTAWAAGVSPVIVQADPNVLHFETLAMLLIERLARCNAGACLYLHTKGASAPADEVKARWRRLMQRELVDRWRELLPHLESYEVAGVDWVDCDRPHFPGNYWLARWDYLARLHDFVAWHRDHRFERFSCEFWIGSAAAPRVLSLVTRGLIWWDLVTRHG